MNIPNDIEFLDLLTIVSFAMQMQFMEQMSHEATNNEVIAHIHHDLETVNCKLDVIMEYLGINLEAS